MELSERVVKSAFDNYGLSLEMNDSEMIYTVSKVIFNHFINKGNGMFVARKKTKLVMSNVIFVDDVLTEIIFHEYR